MMRALATIPLLHGQHVRPGELRRTPTTARRRRLGVADAALGPNHSSVDPLLTAGEVAALLQVTRAWVYAQTRAKQIPHVPLGRYVRYRRTAVLDWLASLERDSCRDGRVPTRSR